MSTAQTTYPGGFIATAPAFNLHEQWTNGTQPGDPTPVGYTAWDVNGNVTAQRALTAAEAAQLAATDATVTTEVNRASLNQRAQAYIATAQTYQALASPTAAQTAAMEKATTKAVTALVRIVLGQLSDMSGT